MTEPLLSFTWRVWCLTPRLDRYYVRIVWRTIASALGGCNHIVARITSRLITFSTHCRSQYSNESLSPPLTRNIGEDAVLHHGREGAALGGVGGQVPAHDVLDPLRGQDEQN